MKNDRTERISAIVIRTSPTGENTIAGLRLRDRLIKGLIKLGCEQIYLSGSHTPYVEEANQQHLAISVITSESEMDRLFPDRENILFLKDDFIISETGLLTILRLPGRHLPDGQHGAA